MRRATGWLRRVEIALWALGISLLGVASGATYARWNYQTQQERALFERGPAVSVSAKAVSPPPAIATVPAPRVEKKQQSAAPRPSAFARIEIPRLGMSAMVKEGADDATLARAVGLVPGSPRPGQIGNMILAGHRDTFFRPLRNIRMNDRIRLVVPPHTYEYEVRTMRVVEPEDTGVLESNGVEEVTLVTCFPFRMVGPAPDRFIVTAARVH